jgi:hypothetical protein
MKQSSNLEQMASKVENLQRLANELYDESEDFPAVNRNVKRILASVQMLKINLEPIPGNAGNVEVVAKP